MSAQELVDIVTRDDEVIKTVPRQVMRAEHLPHRASYIVVLDARGRVLVEVRTLSKDYAPGLFDACVGGVMQSGEDPVVSAGRELFEEIGVKPEQVHLQYLGKQIIPYQKRSESFVMAYLFIAQGDFTSVRQKSEVSGIMYLTPSELRSLKASCTYDSVIAFEEALKRATEQGYLKSEE